MSSEGYHEPIGSLNTATRDLHRALVSLQEELEAVDWYRQRMDACRDDELRAILAHNMEEEVEHASMLIEWLRRRNAHFAEHLSDYLFTEAPITEIEEAEAQAEEEAEGGAETQPKSGLTIGSLKGE